MADDSDSDEWGMEELVIPPKGARTEGITTTKADDDDGYWDTMEPHFEPELHTKEETPADKPKEGEPMMIVDVTQLDATIHSQFDRHSVNDSSAASALRKKIESNYDIYFGDSSLIADGTVIPCGTSVWREALVRLRDERPGHYFAPIFHPEFKMKS